MPMKPVYLHIGTHKTGSTSIQRFLARADGVLADQGILYPETGRPATNWSTQYGQHELYWSIVGKRGIENEQVWVNLCREMEESPCRRVVISAEGFEECTSDEIRRIVAHLEPHPIRIVVYLRPPLQFLRSAYAQRVKKGKNSGPFVRFVREMISRCNYLDLVSRWEQFDAITSVDVRLFDKVKSTPGLEASFADAVGIDFEEVQAFVGSPANASPPDDLIQVARWINTLEAAGGGGKMWKILWNRARSNLFDCQWPGTWIAGVARPFVRESLVTDRAVDVLREELRETHERFLRKYVCPEDRKYLSL